MSTARRPLPARRSVAAEGRLGRYSYGCRSAGGAFMDFGLLVLRLVVGGLFIGHGTQKLFGWFGGYGLEGTGGFMETLGYRPGKRFAVMGGIAEAGGGLLLFLGLLTPLAAAAIIGMMINAIFAVHVENGAGGQNNGYEEPPVLAGGAGGHAPARGGSAAHRQAP